MERYDIELREIPLARFLSDDLPCLDDVNGVLLQSWFDLTPNQLETLIGRINERCPSAEIAYMDWFAPADLRYAAILDGHIAAYVKKQVFADFTQYHEATKGDTNLTDYYCRRFGIELPVTRFHVPDRFEHKLLLGAGFEYSPRIFVNLTKKINWDHRTIDVHARIATRGTDWYSQMRREAFDAAAQLSRSFLVAYSGTVSKRQYFAELYSSKICFSPFGYGEVCWRDFEAISCGALLVKPDMSHLRIRNDPFRPYETYVPIAWDLSDLAEKVDYYLSNEHERRRIAQSAFEHLQSNIANCRFPDDTLELWKRLRLLKNLHTDFTLTRP